MTFQFYADKFGQWFWRLTKDDGRIIVEGADGYASKADVMRVIHAAFEAETALAVPSDEA